MLRSRLNKATRNHIRSNLIGYIALFFALSTGGAVALNGSNTVFTDDIANDTQPAGGGNPAGGLVAADLRASSVGTSEVVNGALNDEDIGQSTYHFLGNIGIVRAQDCVYRSVTGINAQADHLLLTPDSVDTRAGLDYGVEYDANTGSADIRVCNPTTNSIDDGSTVFNLLVIDAE
jgi:hypothetical protein